MGVGVSGWVLARAVASLGQLGVVSGTALDTILVRRLGSGDPGGHVRRAMAAFPVRGVAERVLERYFRPDRSAGDCESEESEGGQRYSLVPLPRAKLTHEREGLVMLANFVEVYLAKDGHAGVVGINYLHKIQFPVLPSLYGAMLAGVHVVLMGAGIPGEIPGVLDRLSRHEDVSVLLDVLDAGEQKYQLSFDPRPLWAAETPTGTRADALADAPVLKRPRFLAIVSSATLARALLKKAPGGIDGFVVEAPNAGGHNAPPRGVQQLSHRGEPIYGERDDVDMTQMAGMGVPFWLAGGYATREKFAAALAMGAHGIQVGTAFAFCEESGLEPGLRQRFLAGVLRGEGDVFTDPDASPTNFPFKVAALKDSLSEQTVYANRPRLCDMGYLRRAYRKADGGVDYRCPAEPVDDYVHKGGKPEDTVGRKCLCNSLLANIGLGQRRSDGYEEPPMLTAGNDLECLRPYISPAQLSYRARDVVESLIPPG
jgi:nitronate monooxygenase